MNAKDEEAATPLHWAAYKGHKEIAKLLIAKGANVNAMAGGRLQSKTPLDFAESKEHKETADLLRKHGAKTAKELKAEGK